MLGVAPSLLCVTGVWMWWNRVLREGETQVLYSVLLHVSGMEIAGIESLVQRVAPGARFQPTELGAPIRGMNDPVVENGVITADQTDPRRRMYEQNIIVHPGIIASVAAVDEENSIVLLWMNFGHTGDQYGAGNALVTFEAFKVSGGEIHSVLAFFKGLPISTARFWPSEDPVRR